MNYCLGLTNVTLDNGISFSFFCTELKYIVSFFFFNQERYLSDTRLKFEENLCLHYITESICIT